MLLTQQLRQTQQMLVQTQSNARKTVRSLLKLEHEPSAWGHPQIVWRSAKFVGEKFVKPTGLGWWVND